MNKTKTLLLFGLLIGRVSTTGMSETHILSYPISQSESNQDIITYSTDIYVSSPVISTD